MARLLSETVAHQLLFIVIEAADELNAYTVFETLNARGKDLTSADLIKNYLFLLIRKNRKNLDFIQSRWKEIVEEVKQERIKHFLRYHMLCKEFPVRERQLFKLMKDNVKDQADVFGLVEILAKRAEPFAAFMDPDHDFWIGMHAARQYIYELMLFRSRQSIPLLFTAWEHLQQEDFVDILNLVSVISFRYTVVSGLVANTLESRYHNAAKAVADGEATNVREVFEKLREVYVSDEKMLQDFGLWVINRDRLAKYVLVCLEESKRSLGWLTPGDTLEHILPKTPRPEWESTYDKALWEPDRNKLGNLTLLEMDDNQKLSNKLYAEKLETYRESKYRITQQIPEQVPEKWTPDFLKERQKKMAERAVQIWRLDFA